MQSWSIDSTDSLGILILQETTIQSLKAIGAAVLSVSEPDTDSDDPTRVLMRQMMGAFSSVRAHANQGPDDGW